VKIKTSDLQGPPLAWAVAKAEDRIGLTGLAIYSSVFVIGSKTYCHGGDGETVVYAPHEDWAQGGPIIDRADIDVFGNDKDYRASLCLHARHPHRNVRSRFPMHGETKLAAAMRCFVASKLGDEVDVPEELA
jgi:hypothetical protein